MRRTNAQLREEYLRLAKCWEYVREIEIARMQLEGAPTSLQNSFPTAEKLISDFDSGNGKPSEHLSGLKEALMDVLPWIAHQIKIGEIASEVLGRYMQETGKDLFLEIVNHKDLARKAARRGRIKDDLEYFALNEVLSDVNQTVFRPQTIDKANKILANYEKEKGSKNT